MRVGFDGHALTSPAAGVRRYARELFGALARIAGGDEILAIGPLDESAVPPNVRTVAARSWLPGNAGWVVGPLAVAARRARLDLFHSPAYTAPLAGVHPLVLTIHDVSYERHPEWYPYRRDPVRRWFYRRSALAADRIVTDSEFSKAEIAAAYGISPDRIHVVPLGLSDLSSVEGHQQGERLPEVGRPYLLHVGDLHVRRNLLLLVRVLHALRRRPSSSELSLVLVGADRGEGSALMAEADRLGISGAVKVLGRVGDRALRALYSGAAAFLYPSRYEGFGLPVLEAMAYGPPVVAANAGSIPEVLGDAGVLLHPDDEQGFAEATERVMHDRQFAGSLKEAARRRAATFTWERAAHQTLAVYRDILA